MDEFVRGMEIGMKYQEKISYANSCLTRASNLLAHNTEEIAKLEREAKAVYEEAKKILLDGFISTTGLSLSEINEPLTRLRDRLERIDSTRKEGLSAKV